MCVQHVEHCARRLRIAHDAERHAEAAAGAPDHHVAGDELPGGPLPLVAAGVCHTSVLPFALLELRLIPVWWFMLCCSKSHAQQPHLSCRRSFPQRARCPPALMHPSVGLLADPADSAPSLSRSESEGLSSGGTPHDRHDATMPAAEAAAASRPRQYDGAEAAGQRVDPAGRGQVQPRRQATGAAAAAAAAATGRGGTGWPGEDSLSLIHGDVAAVAPLTARAHPQQQARHSRVLCAVLCSLPCLVRGCRCAD